MAKKIAELLIKIGADIYGVTKMSSDVRKQLSSLQKDLTSFGKSWSLYVTAPLTAAAGVAVAAADVQLKNEQRLLTALRGREDIQQRLIRQAGELQSRSLFGDEEIIGQQAFLASLGLTEKQINDTIEAAAQLSSATGMTLDSAVKNLAKTYGGLSGELGESIPKLKELTVEQMKNGEAVKFILENYKGFAESAAETGLGPLQQLTVVVGGLVAAVGPLSIGLGSIIKMLPAVKAGLAALTGPLGAIAAMVSIIYLAYSDVQGQIKSLADSDSLEGLERRLEANRAKQQKIVDETTRKRLVVRGSGAAFNMFSIEDAPDRSQLKDLYAEESLLVRAIEQKKQMLEDEARAQDEANQAMEQARIQAEEWLKTINTTGADSNKASGLIGELTDKISKLEEAKTKAASTSEIHNLTLSIAELRDELERLQAIGNSESIAGDTGNLFGKGITPLKFDPNAINPPESDWTEARQNFAANLSNFVAEAQGLVLNAMPAIRNLFANVATSIGEGLGDIFSGDGTFNDLLGGIVKVMGQFLKALGQQLIDLGFEMLAIKETLAAIFNNPWAAIAVGIAAIAAGQAMINSFNKRNEGGVALAEGGLAYGPTMALVGDNRGAGSDPEVIAPLSKLRQYGLGRQTIEFVGGTFRLSGSDLVLAISREQAKINYVNALA